MSGPSTDPVINVCPSCGGKVDATTYVPYTKVECPYCDEAMRVRPLVGERFFIEKEIGAGGMSQVFRAVDQQTGQVVALKLLNWVNSQDPERVQAFEREALLTDQVKNEFVVKLYGQGWDGTMFYYAMELLEGGGLDELMAQGAMSIDQVIYYGSQAVAGLQAADELNLLHRDVKPANLMLDKAGKLRLVDFGLALVHGEMQSEEIWATPWYVSPETLRHERDSVRSDIYSLGMTLRHALMGAPPFDGDLVEPKQLHEIKHTLPPLKSHFPKAKHSEAKLYALIDGMTQFDPNQRTANYADLAAELSKLEKQRQIAQEQGLSLTEYEQRQAKKKRLLLGLGIAGGILLLLILALVLLLQFSVFEGLNEFLRNQGVEIFEAQAEQQADSEAETAEESGAPKPAENKAPTEQE